MTLLVFCAIAALVIAALVRKPQAIMIVLASAFCISVMASQNIDREALRPFLVGIDSLVVAAMVPIWSRFRSQRARIVGLAGLGQVGWATMAGGTTAPWNLWAAVENATFVFQLLVAGGYADGLGTWLADHWHRARFGGRFLHGHVGR